MTVEVQDGAKKGTFGFERKVTVPKVSDEQYGTDHVTASAYFQFDIGDTEAQTEANAKDAAALAKALVYEQIGVDMVLDSAGIVREKQIERAFGPTTNAAPAAPAQSAPPAPAPSSGGPKVIKPLADHPIPEWLRPQYDAAVAAGKLTAGEDVWDNRKFHPDFGGTGSPKGPWFKGKDSGGGIWPPN